MILKNDFKLFSYVANFVFLRYVWIRTQWADVLQ